MIILLSSIIYWYSVFSIYCVLCIPLLFQLLFWDSIYLFLFCWYLIHSPRRYCYYIDPMTYLTVFGDIVTFSCWPDDMILFIYLWRDRIDCWHCYLSMFVTFDYLLWLTDYHLALMIHLYLLSAHCDICCYSIIPIYLFWHCIIDDVLHCFHCLLSTVHDWYYIPFVYLLQYFIHSHLFHSHSFVTTVRLLFRCCYYHCDVCCVVIHLTLLTFVDLLIFGNYCLLLLFVTLVHYSHWLLMTHYSYDICYRYLFVFDIWLCYICSFPYLHWLTWRICYYIVDWYSCYSLYYFPVLTWLTWPTALPTTFVMTLLFIVPICYIVILLLCRMCDVST